MWKKPSVLLLNAVPNTCVARECNLKGQWCKNCKEMFDDITEPTYLEMPYLLWQIVNLYSLKLAFLLLAARNILKVFSAFRRHFIKVELSLKILSQDFPQTICNLEWFLIFAQSKLRVYPHHVLVNDCVSACVRGRKEMKLKMLAGAKTWPN